MFFILTILLAIVCVVGDTILGTANRDIVRGLTDSCTHGVIGIISWLIVALKCHKRYTLIVSTVFEILICGFISAAIDIDHFFYAKSLKLKYVMHLGKNRPPFHCTSVAVLLLSTCLVVGWFWDMPKVWRLGWLVWVAFFSHHIRDASRRGLWVWPFGSTKPIPYYPYVVITLALPYFIMIPLQDSKTYESAIV